MGFDCVIRGGTVVDGTGMRPFTADVAIADGRIARVGRVSEPAGRPPYAPDRVLVKFRDTAIRGSSLAAVAGRRASSAAATETGLPAIDALHREVGATAVTRAHVVVRDRATRKRLPHLRVRDAEGRPLSRRDLVMEPGPGAAPATRRRFRR